MSGYTKTPRLNSNYHDRKYSQSYNPKNNDHIEYVSQKNAEETARKLAKEEGIFSGASTGGALYVALQIAKANKDAVIVSIACDRGDRYLSSNLFVS